MVMYMYICSDKSIYICIVCIEKGNVILYNVICNENKLLVIKCCWEKGKG